MRAGSIIGLPLTLLQFGVHKDTGAHIDPLTIANNFLVCNAIYDADRIDGDFFDPRRTPTRFSAVGSMFYYASSPSTQLITPLVAFLHLFYTSVKPSIAPIKPFFVAFFWTLSIYYVPLLRSDIHTVDPCFSASFFLSIAALSHTADVVDREEDKDNNVDTIAVLMTQNESEHYAIALGLASVLLHVVSDQPFIVYDVVILSTIAGALTQSETLFALFAIVYALAYAREHDVELMSSLLRSTEQTHKYAITYSTAAIEKAFTLPEPYRSLCVKMTLAAVEQGDKAGQLILKFFRYAIMRRLDD